MAKNLLGGGEGHEIEHLQADLETLGQKTADRVGPWPLAVMANLIPTVVAGHILWRVGHAWWLEDYLPGSFYLMAFLLLLASLVPGHVLLATRMRRICKSLDPCRLVDGVEQPLATAPLRTVRERLTDLQRESLALRSTLIELRQELDAELPSAAMLNER
jgi:hypothetical protein